MDKYINAVILEPEVKFARFTYPSSCSQHCLEMNLHFEYGERFVVKCNNRCLKKHDDFIKLYEPIYNRLIKKITDCHVEFSLENQKENLRKCIYEVQLDSLAQLKAYIKENINPNKFI